MLAATISSVIRIKSGKEEGGEKNYGEDLVDANVWLRSVVHLLRSCRGPICDRRTVENQSNGKRFRRYRLPLLTRSSCFVCSFVRYLGHTPGAFWDLAALPGDALGLSPPSCGPDQQFLFKTISGTELRVCTQTCRSANWMWSKRYLKMCNTIGSRELTQDRMTLM